MVLSLSSLSCSFSLTSLSTSLLLLRTITTFNCSNCWPLGFWMGWLESFSYSLLPTAMATYPSSVPNLAINCEWELTICILDSILWALDSTFCTIETKVQDRNYLFYISAPRYWWERRGVSLQFWKPRGVGLVDWALGFSTFWDLYEKITMIPLTMIISIRIRIIGWRKSLDSIHLFSQTFKLTNTRTIKRSMHGTSRNWTRILHGRAIRHFVHVQQLIKFLS